VISEFTANMDFKRVIEEQQIRPNRVRAFLKENGIVLLNGNAKDLSSSVYTLFLGSQDMTMLQELMMTEKNYQKSTMLILDPIEPDQTQDLFKEILLDELNRFQSVGHRYTIEDISNDKAGNTHVKLSYVKHVTGRMAFVSKKKKVLNLHVEKIPKTNKIKIDVRQTDSSDAKEFLNFIEAINSDNGDEGNIFNVNHIQLQSLTKQNRVEFFDMMAKYSFANWGFENITGISVSKSEDENEQEDEELESEHDDIGTLAGISSAILKGKALRTNEFVQMCIDKGFMITAMKYRYRHKKESKSFVIDINFKNKDIGIDIDKTYIKEDGRDFVTPLPVSEQDEIIKLFQASVFNIFKGLLEKQKALALQEK
jgi:hypothetical protein